MEKTFNNARLLAKEYGQLAQVIQRRMAFMKAAPRLADVPSKPPTRCHPLTGSRNNQYAVDLSGNDRLIFEVATSPIPLKEDGSVDLQSVTAIRILSVEDYH